MSEHAKVPRDGFMVPLIGIPKDATEEKCARCGKVLPLTEAYLRGSEYRCKTCVGKKLPSMTNPIEPRKPGRPPIRGETAGAHVHIRTTLDRKNAWVKAAKPRKLSEWVTETVDQAAGYRENS